MKKVISLFLCMAMAFLVMTTCVPVAFAAEYSGSCGNSITWNLDTYSGVLTVRGNGDMKDYTAEDMPSWSAYQNYIKTVNFEDGITSVGAYAFYNLTGFKYTKLTAVNLSSTVTVINPYAFRGCKTIKNINGMTNVTEIGEYAFRSCSGIETVSLGSSLEKIGNGAFSYCSSLVSVPFPSTIKTISNAAFENCTSLQEVVIPSTVTTLGSNAFADCSALQNVEYSASGITVCSYGIFSGSGSPDGMTAVFSENITTVPANIFANCIGLTSVTLGSSVTTIGDDAFYSSGLKSVNIPAKTKTISDSAFAGCNSLAAFTVDSSNSTFSAGSNGELLNNSKTILYRYPSGRGETSYSMLSTVVAIRDGAFMGDTTLQSVDTGKVTYVYGDAFQQCTALTEVSMPKVKTVKSYGFADCDSLKTVTAPALTVVELCAFYGCDSLTNLDGFTALETINSHAFSNCDGFENLTIPSTVETIGEYAFSNNDKLVTLVVPSSVTTIGEGAFVFCDSLNSVTLNEGLKTIKVHAFVNCPALMEMTIPASVETIDLYSMGYKWSSGPRYTVVSGFKIYCYEGSGGYNYVNNSGDFSYEIITDSVEDEIIIPETPSQAEKPESVITEILKYVFELILKLFKVIG